MRLAVVIPAHSHAAVVKLTVGSLIRTHSKRYDLDIHVGVHSNYHHYTQDLRLFEDLRGVAQVHMVDEIDWLGEYNSCWYRYSVMHAKNLMNLLKCVRYCPFDRLLVLDHDVFIKEDFVSKCLERHPETDFVGSLFGGGFTEFATSGTGLKMYAMQKISGWHLLMSRRVFDKAVDDPGTVFPRVIEGDAARPYREAYGGTKDIPVFFDVMTELVHRARRLWGMSFGEIDPDLFASWAEHFHGTSFNYGRWAFPADYERKIAEIREIYDREFPGGLPARGR